MKHGKMTARELKAFLITLKRILKTGTKKEAIKLLDNLIATL